MVRDQLHDENLAYPPRRARKRLVVIIAERKALRLAEKRRESQQRITALTAISRFGGLSVMVRAAV
jgi:hypothetical protein